VGYVGAGTVEFIVDQDLKHWFLEMNTRLQVEHPVTECITGFDLVEWQLRVAAGEPLPATQQQVHLNGHAIELRLYTEDPYDGYKPQTGRIAHWRPDAARATGVRVDDGIAEGGIVGPYYDAMVAKLIAHGRDRADAVRQLVAALAASPLLGVRNNARFLADLLRCDEFTGARMTTTLLDEWATSSHTLMLRPLAGDDAWLIAAAARVTREGTGWRPASLATYALTLTCDSQTRALRVRADAAGVQVTHGDATHTVRIASRDEHVLTLELDGARRRAIVADDGQTLHLALDGSNFTFTEASPWPQRDSSVDPRRARAPVAGVVAQVLVRAGDAVAAGQQLVSVEAMKMEMWLTAGAAGTVRAVLASPKAPVESGAVLVELEIPE
jgi:geranyl-CoA carboxylase alpha subunit